MGKIKKDDYRVVVPSQDISVSSINIHRTERNSLYFPVFDLSKSSKRDTLEVKEVVYRDKQKTEIKWKVQRGIKNNFPSSEARKIHKMVVEKIINEMPRPIQNPIRIGSLKFICREIGIERIGGSETPPAERVASGSPLEGGDKIEST